MDEAMEAQAHLDRDKITMVTGLTEEQELDEFEAHTIARLQGLRAQFPPERIEKLPKPLWGGAWDGESKSHCDECGGYHVKANTIHLDYVGHANATDRILDVDPFWEWEPLAYTAEGLPLFDRSGGLWIKLTICGVTRLGYGDGKSPKEIIGDAVRNAAMRFGLALDLWAKINLHEERNPGNGPTPAPRQSQSRADGRPQGAVHPNRGQEAAPATQSRGPNQDALDSLGSVCDENGLDRRTMRDRYAAWVGDQSVADTKIRVTDLLDAPTEYIIAFAAHLLEGLEPPDGPADLGEDGAGGAPDGAGAGSAPGEEPAGAGEAPGPAEAVGAAAGDADVAQPVPGDSAGDVGPSDGGDAPPDPERMF